MTVVYVVIGAFVVFFALAAVFGRGRASRGNGDNNYWDSGGSSDSGGHHGHGCGGGSSCGGGGCGGGGD
jgi:hypothetical protein